MIRLFITISCSQLLACWLAYIKIPATEICLSLVSLWLARAVSFFYEFRDHESPFSLNGPSTVVLLFHYILDLCSIILA